MSSAGYQLVAGRIPGERIATTIRTSDSSGVTTTETTIDSVTAALVTGRTYRVRWTARVDGSVNADTLFVRIREDNVSGNQLQILRVEVPATGGVGTGYPGTIEAEYTAVATGNKTFVGTIVRASGTGTVNIEAGPNRPVYLYVDYIRG
jgi:hypothetical protein